MMKIKETEGDTGETRTTEASHDVMDTSTESWRSKSLYVIYNNSTRHCRIQHPFMKKNDDDKNTSSKADTFSSCMDGQHSPVVNMGVFELNSKVYMIAEKSPADESPQAVYAVEVTDGDKELHLRVAEDFPPLPVRFPTSPIVAKMKGDIYVLYTDCGCIPAETFFVLRSNNNSWERKTLPLPPYCNKSDIWDEHSPPSFVGVVGTRLWMDGHKAMYFYDVETEAWGLGTCPFECRWSPITLSITTSSYLQSDSIVKSYVVICIAKFEKARRMFHLHAVLVSEFGEALCYQEFAEAEVDSSFHIDMPWSIRVVELDSDGKCSMIGALYNLGGRLIQVKIWTVSFLETMTLYIPDLDCTKVRPIISSAKTGQAIYKKFLDVNVKETSYYELDDSIPCDCNVDTMFFN